jgi:hypothetical protein
MEKVKKVLNKGYTVIAMIAIVLVLLLINFFHITSGIVIKNVVFILLGIAVMFLINKFVINKLKSRAIKICIITLLVLFLILEIVTVIFFRVEYNWDFKWIMDSSHDIATTGTTANTFYFKMFPNNWGTLAITTVSMFIAGGSEVGAYVANVIFIFLAALFTVLSARKIGGDKLGLNVLILLIGCAPLYLYSPIVYSDSLSVMFPVATLYFWLLSKENREKNQKKKSYIWTIVMALTGIIGYCIKPVAAIVLAAIVIDEFFTNLNKETLKKLAITLIIVLSIMKLFNFLGEKIIIKDARKNDLEFPMTHWVMMGLNRPESEGGTAIGYGAYSQKDADFTAESGNYQEKKAANIHKIKERLLEYGFGGYIQFLLNKFNYVWNDGGYYAIHLIGWDTLNTESGLYKMIADSNSNEPFKNYMTDFNNFMFLTIIAGFVIELIKKKQNQESRIMGTSIVGIALFLLIWEARSRYVYFLIPMFCLFSAYELKNILDLIEIFIQKKKNKNVSEESKE